jgi:glycosyltransferase involved in cell wall biosynthesis
VKVLIVKEALPSGGAERQLSLIAEHLPPEWERRVWTMGGGPFVDVLAARGVRVDVDARRSRLDVRPALGLWRLLLSWRPDVVHSWDWMSTLAALPVCRALGIPIVDSTIRNGIARRRRALPLRLAMAASRLVVANSAAGLRVWSVAPTKGRVVYNAFDPARWPLAEVAADTQADGAVGDAPARDDGAGGCVAGRRTVVMTGRMVTRKDFASVIAVARVLDAERPGHWRFLLVGEGPDEERLRGLAGDLVTSGAVEFAAPGLEVLPLVREADVGVLMSDEVVHREGCSNAIMEFMACALPVVCSSGGGNPELVAHGETGYLVPGGDTVALAARLRALDEQPELALRLGGAGRQRLRERFTLERMIAGIDAAYREAAHHDAALGRSRAGEGTA